MNSSAAAGQRGWEPAPKPDSLSYETKLALRDLATGAARSFLAVMAICLIPLAIFLMLNPTGDEDDFAL